MDKILFQHCSKGLSYLYEYESNVELQEYGLVDPCSSILRYFHSNSQKPGETPINQRQHQQWMRFLINTVQKVSHKYMIRGAMLYHKNMAWLIVVEVFLRYFQ